MKALLLTGVIALLPIAANAQSFTSSSQPRRVTIQPERYDFNPNDGFMDPGSYQNPYEVEYYD